MVHAIFLYVILQKRPIIWYIPIVTYYDLLQTYYMAHTLFLYIILLLPPSKLLCGIPIKVAKETYLYGKRDLLHGTYPSKETYHMWHIHQSGKRDLGVKEKKPTFRTKETW